MSLNKFKIARDKMPTKKWVLSVLIFGLAMSAPALSSASDIEWNGFGSGYYGQALDKNFLNYGFKNTNVDFTDFSLMGLNVAGKFTDELTFAGQIIAQGLTTPATNSFNLSAQWAFLSYRPDDSTQIKVGRQLYPFSIASEYASVGYLLPYQILPHIVYALIPFNAFDGVSVARFIDTPVGRLKAEIFGGTPVFTIASVAVTGTYSLENLIGTSLSLEGEGYEFHLSASVEMDQGAAGNGPSAYDYSSHAQRYSLGYKFEKLGFVSWTEAVVIYTPDAVSIPPQPYGPNGSTPGGKFLGFGQSAYSLLGYRIGKFMPRYTFGEGVFLAGLINGAETTHTVGLNYQFKPQVVLKAEYNLDVVPAGRKSFTGVQSVTNPSSTGSDFLVGVDFIF